MLDPGRVAAMAAGLVAAAMLAAANDASAIERSSNGAGEYLIVPLALANGDNETLIEISDATQNQSARALKLRLLDRDGQPRLTANLYLPRRATWAGGLTRHEGTARLVTPSASCLLIDGPGGIEAVSQVDMDFSAGSLEVVEMGVVAEPPLADHVTANDCAAIVDLWNDGGWAADAALEPPVGGLRTSARIINVEKGTLYGVPSTALDDFSNIAQHEPPGSAKPDLASTHDEGTPMGQTRSVVCIDGACIEDFWDDPVDAASAALSTYTASDTYDIDESLNALGEWIVTFPAMAYYSESHSLSSARVSLLIADRFGDRKTGGIIPVPPNMPFVDSTTVWMTYDSPVNPLDLTTTVSDVGTVQASSLFQLQHPVQSPGENYADMGPEPGERFPDNGQARLGFACGGITPALVAQSGRQYPGCPAIVTTFTEYTNGVLSGADGVPQRANYGSSGQAASRVRILEPEG